MLEHILFYACCFFMRIYFAHKTLLEKENRKKKEKGSLSGRSPSIPFPPRLGPARLRSPRADFPFLLYCQLGPAPSLTATRDPRARALPSSPSREGSGLRPGTALRNPIPGIGFVISCQHAQNRAP